MVRPQLMKAAIAPSSRIPEISTTIGLSDSPWAIAIPVGLRLKPKQRVLPLQTP